MERSEKKRFKAEGIESPNGVRRKGSEDDERGMGGGRCHFEGRGGGRDEELVAGADRLRASGGADFAASAGDIEGAEASGGIEAAFAADVYALQREARRLGGADEFGANEAGVPFEDARRQRRSASASVTPS